MRNIMWVEKYRPKSLDEIVNQNNIVSRLKNFVIKKEMPHLLFVGPEGVGKVSSILALAQNLYGSTYQNYVWEINVFDEPALSRPMKKEEVDKFIKKIKNFASTTALADTTIFKIIIMNDADSLNKNAQHAFRRIMEKYTLTCRFCLICTNLERIIDPIRSRCSVFNFIPLKEEDIKGLLSRIAIQEKVLLVEEGLDILYIASKGNMRNAINILQAAAAISRNREVDDSSIYNVIKELAPHKIREMIKLSMIGNFIEAREILRSLLIDDNITAENILEETYNELMCMSKISKEWKIKLTDTVSQVDYNLTQGERKEIQLSVLLSKLALVGKE